MTDILIRVPDLVRVGPDAADKADSNFIFLDATLSEEHSNTYQLTTHAMGEGLDITDHKRREPRKLTIEAQISNTPLFLPSDEITAFEQLDTVAELEDALDGESQFSFNTLARRDIAAWEQLKAYQESNDLISVYTQLEVYQNMQIISINTTRTAETSNVLRFTMTLQEVRVANAERVEALQAPRPEAQPRPKRAKKRRRRNDNVDDSVPAGGCYMGNMDSQGNFTPNASYDTANYDFNADFDPQTNLPTSSDMLASGL